MSDPPQQQRKKRADHGLMPMDSLSATSYKPALRLLAFMTDQSMLSLESHSDVVLPGGKLKALQSGFILILAVAEDPGNSFCTGISVITLPREE